MNDFAINKELVSTPDAGVGFRPIHGVARLTVLIKVSDFLRDTYFIPYPETCQGFRFASMSRKNDMVEGNAGRSLMISNLPDKTD